MSLLVWLLKLSSDRVPVRSSLEQSIIDNNLLMGVKRWLEPLPDKSLPALNIQQEFFRTLPEFKWIDAAVLKESQLGRIILFYTKCKRVTPEVHRAANGLVSKWSRPIIKRSASYRDRVVPVAAEADDGERKGERLNQILARAREEEKGRIRRNHVMIPHREAGTYTIAPRSTIGLGNGNASVDNDIRRRKANADRLRSLTRKVTTK
jgi:transcription factor SPN1